MEAFTLGVIAFALATHGTGTVGVDTSGAVIGRVRVVNDMVQPFNHPVILGTELAMQPIGGAYQPKFTASVELMLFKF